MNDPQPPDLERIVATLARHRVDYLLVGGVAAATYGATRPTYDFDCLANRTPENLARLAGAMRELNARLRVAGLTDNEARRLPSQVTSQALSAMELSTWRTDAGDFDVLADMPDRTGRGRGYSELVGQATNKDFAGTTVIVAALDDVIDSKRWANRPKDQAALLELDALAAERHVGFDSSAIEIVDLEAGDDLER